uniref:Cadherin domain-containing protein n=1 Tax=Anolis carolinensis TaxID=28377 RepID=A0A803T5D9_ANOCA
MDEIKDLWSCKKRTLQWLFILFLWKAASGQIHYTIPEEMPKGSFVGNIAKDLGMNGKQLSDHGLRIVTSKGMIQYFALNVNSGHLQISEKIDREKICGEIEKCMLKFQVLMESKLKLYSVEVEITDINDNAPQFRTKDWKMKLNEITTLTERFLLPKAQDPDLGINSIQSYELTGSNHFSLEVQRGENGARQAELVLEKPLDREEQSAYDLILTATDGGDPVKSGTLQIHIIVLDANDNMPVFSQSVYEMTIKENIPKGSTVATIRATDPDEGINGEVKYSFQEITNKATQIFQLDNTTGEIILAGNLDYEESSFYEFEVQAMDGGGLSDRSKVFVFVSDLNDNEPELTLTFAISSIPENSPTGTTVAILNVRDKDSGVNGQVTCSIPSSLPFELKKTQDDFYTLLTERRLDREEVAIYNIIVRAVDEGSPTLSTSEIISLKVLDTNDNPPAFIKSSYTSYLLENNPRENARITYFMIESQVRESLLSSYLSINSETGVVYALNSFDYEEIQEIRFLVKAQDGGSPPLSSNVSVTLFILDENDNAPEILYPSPPTDGSTGIELAPRSSEPDYLLTHSGSINFGGVPVSQFVGIDGVRAFLHSYCHEVSLTSGSRKSQFNTSKVNDSKVLTNQQNSDVKDPILSRLHRLNQAQLIWIIIPSIS